MPFIPESSLEILRILYPSLSFELKADSVSGGAFSENILNRSDMRDNRELAERAIEDGTNYELMAAARLNTTSFAKAWGYD